MITPEKTVRRGASTVGVLLSGGLDSSILLGRLLAEGKRIQPFFIRSGLVWQQEELSALRRFLDAIEQGHNEGHAGVAPSGLAPLVVLDLPLGDLYGGHWSTSGQGTPRSDSEDRAVYMPGRNVLLVVKAAIWCQLHGVGELCLGLLGTSPFEDAGAEFFENLQGIINSGPGQGVRLERPFAVYNKVDVMRLGQGLPLGLTFSCIAPRDGLHCGRCNKCAERMDAFAAAGMEDPTEYAVVGEMSEGRVSDGAFPP
ncbi:MAG: 7-cyano-7-deazaguanine synthase [Planctomycetota bacterium]|nr:7-cyano-7-deazaguanine synthase [Planctomycetota bacterium]